MCALIKISGIDYTIPNTGTYDNDKKSPHYPLTYDPYEKVFYEGFWYNSEEPHFPFPRGTDTKLNPEFIRRMKYLVHKCHITMYMGYSHCRLCGFDRNGDSDCGIRGDGKVFFFPNGIIHYYEAHNVLPSEDFYNFVMRIKM